MDRTLATDPPAMRLGAARAWALCWVVVALSNALAITLLRMPGRVGTRLAHYAFDSLQMVAVAVAGMAVIALFQRLAAGKRRASLVALVLLSLGVANWTLVPDFAGWAERMDTQWLAYPGAALASLSVPASLIAGRLLDAGRRRYVAVALALVVLVAHHLLLPGAYPGIHLYWLWSATTLVARALVGAPIPRASARLLPSRPALRLAGGVLVVAAAMGSLVLWPSPVVVSQMFQVSGSVLVPFLAEFHGLGERVSLANDRTSERFIDKQWLEPRDRLPSIAASRPSLLPERPLVILLTIDALRADVANELRTSGRFPNIERLARESVEFTNARAPASATRHTLAAIFTGRYPSQMEWARKELVDKAPKITSFLRKADIRTVHVASHPSIGRGWGLVGRFDKTVFVREKQAGQEFPLSREAAPAAIAELDSLLEQPSFLFMHWLDPHYPYNSRGKEGTNAERYRREAESCDEMFGTLRKALEDRGAWDRTVVILSADHGEAFGAHGVFAHGDALYEVLLRVPLMIRVPGVKPMRLDAPVSSIDLGPTVLDLFGVATPPTFLGQSLVPFLRGEQPKLTRPLAADSTTALSLLIGRHKVIDDRRKHVAELYDVVQDPDERDNVFGYRSEDDELMLKALNRFFAVHSQLRGADRNRNRERETPKRGRRKRAARAAGN